eukprot:CAMPEP_0115859306 /NCGR_PEP_ID=MMETSP0287-20121206/16548_1 /TAXON_ID=412157 /ORGANISM="Chrysochromulina rotalis, Strain UIO044" /LENGTH=198 /DNA_ID=CAMNT_0003313603 /DNA_START=12 /DNA_END=608 /DNA_ORIENTATION=-
MLQAEGAIAGLDYTDVERRKLATASRRWQCPNCQLCMSEVLPLADSDDASVRASSLPAPPAELTFAHEGPSASHSTSAAGPSTPVAASSSASAASEVSASSTPAASLGTAECSECSDGSPPTAKPEVEGPVQASPGITLHASPPAVTGAAAPPRLAVPVSQSSLAAPSPPTDWLGLVAACLVGLIALLLTKKLMGDTE